MKQKLITLAIQYSMAASGWTCGYYLARSFIDIQFGLCYCFVFNTIGWIAGQISMHRKHYLARLKRQQNNNLMPIK